MSTYQRLAAILASVLAVEECEISADIAPVSDLGADSLHLAEIVMQIETEFGIEIGDDETAELGQTVGEMTAFIERRIGERP